MTFRVGMPVKCIDATGRFKWAGDPLVEGQTYFVRSIGIGRLTGNRCIWLVGMRNRVRRRGILDEDAGYYASRFRPAVSPGISFDASIPADPDSEQYDNRRRVPVSEWGCSA